MNRVYIDRVTAQRRGQTETYIEVWDNEAEGKAEPLEGPATDDLDLLRQCRACGDAAVLDILEAARVNHDPVYIGGATYPWATWVAVWDEPGVSTDRDLRSQEGE